MKDKTLILTCLALTAIAAGCDKPETTPRKLDQIQEKTAAAAQDMKDYAYAQKAEFTARMQTQLAEINRDLDELAAKIEKSSDEIKAEAQPKLQALRDVGVEYVLLNSPSGLPTLRRFAKEVMPAFAD